MHVIVHVHIHSVYVHVHVHVHVHGVQMLVHVHVMYSMHCYIPLVCIPRYLHCKVKNSMHIWLRKQKKNRIGTTLNITMATSCCLLAIEGHSR